MNELPDFQIIDIFDQVKDEIDHYKEFSEEELFGKGESAIRCQNYIDSFKIFSYINSMNPSNQLAGIYREISKVFISIRESETSQLNNRRIKDIISKTKLFHMKKMISSDKLSDIEMLIDRIYENSSLDDDTRKYYCDIKEYLLAFYQ
ncbi:MAG: hypothetical protein ACLFPQ_06575 [Candidatus Woesearchaeota archaeon]